MTWGVCHPSPSFFPPKVRYFKTLLTALNLVLSCSKHWRSYDWNCVQFQALGVVKSWCSGESVVALGEQKHFSNRAWRCRCVQTTVARKLLLWCMSWCSDKTLHSLTTGSDDHLYRRHDVSALALSSQRVRFPGFTTWRCRVRFRSPILND